jgi:hypothetical protein
MRLRFLVPVALVSCAAAQQSRPAETATVEALLAEVRQLRVALQHAFATMPRVQLTLQKMQFQQQRVDRVSQRLDDVRRSIGHMADQVGRAQARRQELETRLGSEQDPNMKRQLAAEFEGMSRAVEEQSIIEQRMRAEEAEAQQALRTEEARLSEIAEQLEQLEKRLDRQ